jgi:hypothetical protein
MHLVSILGAPISVARDMALAAFLGLVAGLCPPASATEPGSGRAASEQIDFDIPAQPLAVALERYGARSGRQVVYDSALAEGRMSAPVEGSFTPELALQNLLAGTGLVPRYVAADAFVLVRLPPAALPRQAPVVNTASPAAVARYYGRIQARLKRAFCDNERTRRGGYRVALGLWIDASGVVNRVARIGPTGDPDLDATIDHAVIGLAIGEAPPVGFAQPVVLVVVPELAWDCQGRQPAEAGP